jgi:LysM repeat protein
MGSIIGPTRARQSTSAILALIGLLVAACVALAAPADFSERDLQPPPKARRAPEPPARHAPKRVQPTSFTEDQGASQEETDEEAPAEGPDEGAVPAPARRTGGARHAAPSADSSDADAPAANTGDLSYEIHSGDSVGGVAEMFHLPPEEIFRHNHLRPETTLHVGQVLRIPNPYAAQVRQLQGQLDLLRARNQQQDRRFQEVNSKEAALNARITELTESNRALEHDVMTLPWWRRATMLVVMIATLMIGIAGWSFVQWFLVRRRFAAVAQANEKLSKLDQRYRLLLARAELRLQQLYGRRRAAVEPSAQPRNPEDLELERINRDLKDVLEQQMAQLGVESRAPARRSRFREWLASLGSPVAVRSDRR